jgi:IS1 family transposase
MRSICRIFRVSLGWLYRFMLEHLEQMSADLKLHVTEAMLSEDADFEVDELCTYVRNKKAKVWVWIVYHRQTKQIVAFHMGCRGIKTCKKLWRKLQEIGIKGRLHTDLWKAYAAVFPKNQHLPHEKRGATNHIERFLRSRLSRLVRKTYSFAKSYRNLFLSLRFFITNYNASLL